MHTDTHTHKYIKKHTQTLYKYIQRNTHSDKHTHTHTHKTLTNMHAPTGVPICAYIHTQVNTKSHTHILTAMHRFLSNKCHVGSVKTFLRLRTF